jgi:hypothetical protein
MLRLPQKDLLGIHQDRGDANKALPNSRQYEAEFFALPEDDQLSEYGRPGPAAQHLFSKTSCEWKQNRINKLLAALDEHTASCDALKAEIGCHEADDLVHELYEPIVDIISRMEAIEPMVG